MKEVIITSSVLIAVVLLARWMFRNKVSQRLIYASWLLVALRLLIPIQFGQSQYSVTTLTEKIETQSHPIQQVQQALQEPVAGPSRAELYEQLLGEYLQEMHLPEAPQIPTLPNASVTVTPEVQQAIEAQVEAHLTAPTLAQILRGIWAVGVFAMGGWFAAANLIFLHRAKKDSVTADFGKGAIRISPNVPTPCVVGFVRPVIYLTPASAENEQIRAHVLAHEGAHLRHGDHIWAVVRCVCLCIYWFNPLVWIAAAQSRRDCELACDESALNELGDGQRIAYGKTLLDIVSQSMSPVHLLETATAMNESKKQLKERLNYIVSKPRTILIAAICMVLVAALTAGCAFTGASSDQPTGPTGPSTQPTNQSKPTAPSSPTDPDTPTEPDFPDLQTHISTLFDKPDSWYRRALTSDYTDPKDANIARFFNLGFSDEVPITDGEWNALKDIPGFVRNEKLHRLPAKRMNQVLKQVFGLTLSQMNGIGMEKLTYLETTDCYYLMGGEDALSELHFNQSVGKGNNLYINANLETWAVYITVTKDGPRIEQNSMSYLNQVMETTELAKEYLGMTRLEFLYTSALLLQEKMKAEGWSQEDMESVYRNAHSIKNRSLYLEDGVLMMKAQYSALADPEDPLRKTVYIPYTYTAGVDNLETQSYLWLFKMESHVDGFVADAYATLLLDCAFAEPESFLKYLAEFDEETIRMCQGLMYYGIVSQEEADLFSQLLTAISSQADLNNREQRTLEILAQVPDWFSYSISPELAPKVQGNAATMVSGQDPDLPNGLVTTPPDNTLTHTHVYSDTTVAPTCAVKGYDYHLCRCGAYYCDNFKDIVAHDYQFSALGAMRAPTYDEPGYRTIECQRCADRYLAPVSAGKDLDLAGVIAQCEAYAESLGFRVVAAEDWDHHQSRQENSTVDNVLSAYYEGTKPIKERIVMLIDRIANNTNNRQLYVLCIQLSPYPYYSQTPTGYSITVTLGFE